MTSRPDKLACLLASLSCPLLSGCGPQLAMRAPIPMPSGRPNEVAVGVGGFLTAPHPIPSASGPSTSSEPRVLGGTVQVAYTRRLTSGAELGGVAYAAGTGERGCSSCVPSAGGGLQVRLPLIAPPERAAAGIDLELGWLWAGAGLPAALRTSQGAWVFTRPMVVIFSAPDILPGFVPGYRIPAGIAVDFDGTLVVIEAGVHLAGAGAVPSAGRAVISAVDRSPVIGLGMSVARRF